MYASNLVNGGAMGKSIGVAALEMAVECEQAPGHGRNHSLDLILPLWAIDIFKLAYTFEASLKSEVDLLEKSWRQKNK